MMIQAMLGNPHHPEYGVATIPFPIPHDQYAHCMELLETLEIGDAVKADCQVQEINSFYSVLKRTEMLTVNVEELNYLAKRLDSFDTGEAAQFQAMAHKLELFELKDLINLTFCCQQATVITDFSDLAAVGRDHYMNLHGGSASVDELNKLNGEETARRLIESGSGTITPYGVVYDNGMEPEQVYDGQFFPGYYYEPNAITIAVTAKSEPEDTEHITWLYEYPKGCGLQHNVCHTGICHESRSAADGAVLRNRQGRLCPLGKGCSGSCCGVHKRTIPGYDRLLSAQCAPDAGFLAVVQRHAGTAWRSASLELDTERCDHGGRAARRGAPLAHPAGYSTESIQVRASANDRGFRTSGKCSRRKGRCVV